MPYTREWKAFDGILAWCHYCSVDSSYVPHNGPTKAVCIVLKWSGVSFPTSRPSVTSWGTTFFPCKAFFMGKATSMLHYQRGKGRKALQLAQPKYNQAYTTAAKVLVPYIIETPVQTWWLSDCEWNHKIVEIEIVRKCNYASKKQVGPGSGPHPTVATLPGLPWPGVLSCPGGRPRAGCPGDQVAQPINGTPIYQSRSQLSSLFLG